MISEEYRNEIKCACRLFGGQKAVAISAGVDNSNFGKWLKGGHTLSEENINSVLSAMGISDCQPDNTHVHTWFIKNTFLVDMSQVLKLYFPHGGAIKRAPWVTQGISLRDSFGIGDSPETLYAIFDGSARGVLRMPSSLILKKENMKSFLKWSDKTPMESVLYIDRPNQSWISGRPSVEQFDSAWNATSQPFSPKDVLKAILDEGITYEEAVNRIKLER